MVFLYVKDGLILVDLINLIWEVRNMLWSEIFWLLGLNVGLLKFFNYL